MNIQAERERALSRNAADKVGDRKRVEEEEEAVAENAKVE